MVPPFASRTASSTDEAVRAAYDAHGRELYGFALRSVRDAATAQDVVQETFLRAWRFRDRYDADAGAMRGWLFSIARNVVVDLYRAQAARPRSEPLDEGGPDPQVARDEVEQLMQRWVVEEAMRRLGDDHRYALERTYLADRPYAEVAAELGISESTLRSRVFYGLKSLRVIMEEMEGVR